MTPRQKVGFGLLGGAAVLAVHGLAALLMPADPSWLPYVEVVLGAIAGIFGIVLKKDTAPKKAA